MDRRFASLALILLILASVPSRAQQLPGPQGQEEGPLRRQLWLVPSAVPNVMMQTTIFRPQGRGPFSLAIINHGSTANADDRADFPRLEFESVATWFVRHGYLVALPQRPGHGQTGGPYLEEIGSCDNADYLGAGLGAAASMETAINYFIGQPFVRKSGVVLVGQSAGAWGALAAASRNPSGVAAVINFAGGLGGRSYGKPNRNCAPGRLIESAHEFGRTARVPTLWIYAENDTFFGAALSRRMADGFREAGGLAEYHLLPPFGEDGHFLIFSPAAIRIWAPIVVRFLRLPPEQ
jgi:dienelactone hydrolase